MQRKEGAAAGHVPSGWGGGLRGAGLASRGVWSICRGRLPCPARPALPARLRLILKHALSNAGLAFLLVLVNGACGRKGDPIPRPRAEPQAPEAHWVALRQLEVTLPARDARGESLVGLERLRVFY